MDIDVEIRDELVAAARAAAKQAYCPYSKFHVGAAVVSGNHIFTGCNVENASYGLAICAERVAIFKMISAGFEKIDAIAVACTDVNPEDPDSSKMPCGACRQVIAEFASPETPVFVDGWRDVPLSQLLPSPFG